MKVNIVRNPQGYYDLWVDGRRHIEGETFTVVSSVEAALLDRTDGTAETDEVAQAIRGETPCKTENRR